MPIIVFALDDYNIIADLAKRITESGAAYDRVFHCIPIQDGYLIEADDVEGGRKYSSNAERQKAYRARKRNAPRNEPLRERYEERYEERYANRQKSGGVTGLVTQNPSGFGVTGDDRNAQALRDNSVTPLRDAVRYAVDIDPLTDDQCEIGKAGVATVRQALEQLGK